MCPTSQEFKARAGKPVAGFLIWFLASTSSGHTLKIPVIGPTQYQSCTFVPPQFEIKASCGACKEIAMKKLLVAVLIGGSFISLEARAQERAGDAALGAVSGAVVLGPVGAVAGALIGYTAGPSISRSWGVGRSASRPRVRRVMQSSLVTRESGTQGVATHESGTQEQAALKANAPPALQTSETVGDGRNAPPVQGFE
jgi:hypothetical protein